MLNWIKARFGQTTSRNERQHKKRALALICYCQYEYFSDVLNSVLQQKINGENFSAYYDLYIFQDGLQDRHLTTNQLDHSKVTQLARATVDPSHFFLQESNLGIAKHFDFIESYLYESKGYSFVVFCEHDMVLGEHYLDGLNQLADLHDGDPRIGMISMHSRNRRKSVEDQHMHCDEYCKMGHSWGFGMFRDSWLAIRPLVKEYLNLLGDMPYYQRNHILIIDWLTRKGFKPHASSQDNIKACALTSAKHIRVSSFVNFGQYIGAQGEHFTPAQFKQMGFDNNVLYDRSLGNIKKISQADYQRILDESIDNLFIPGKAPLIEQAPLSFPANMLSSKMTEEDAVAAYKFFLGRLPESMEMIRERAGLPCEAVFKSFLGSDEFLHRQEYWPQVVSAAKKIVDLHAKLEQKKISKPPDS
jgi:hypothetical protein